LSLNLELRVSPGDWFQAIITKEASRRVQAKSEAEKRIKIAKSAVETVASKTFSMTLLKRSKFQNKQCPSTFRV